MEATSFTIGMAGHIDHGKTALTKALTGIDTDRLKEEKERKITIELGYAPLKINKNKLVSIIDVPGHERFIRQMIAGVAGIDLVILVIAADEGVMPQTKEHVQILEFLRMKRGIIAISKIDLVDDEWVEVVKEDIRESFAQSFLRDAPIIGVSSLSGHGVSTLLNEIDQMIEHVQPRNRNGSFRLPIDQVFTVQGHGTIVRGTIYEGAIEQGEQLFILPSQQKARARNIQVHHEDVVKALAGQRVAINISGVSHDSIQRGDVVVTSESHFIASNVIDVALRFVHDLRMPLKQRSPIKVYIGTTEAFGKIVFFDRNEVFDERGEVLCQLKLDKSVVVRRGDRLIIRRPTPIETIGGGWVINPVGKKYRFGQQTIQLLKDKIKQTPAEIISSLLMEYKQLSIDELIQLSSLTRATITNGLENKDIYIQLPNNKFVLESFVKELEENVLSLLNSYHQQNPMRLGMNKSELLSSLQETNTTAIDYAIQSLINNQKLAKNEQFIHLYDFIPHIPEKWQSLLDNKLNILEHDGLQVKKWEEYLINAPLTTQESTDIRNYLIKTNQVYALTEELLIHETVLKRSVTQLKNETGNRFELKDAKQTLHISRKYIVPFLELLDELKITVRKDSYRYWL